MENIISEKNLVKDNEKEDIIPNEKNTKNKNQPQFIKLLENKETFYFKTKSYGLLFQKLNINWNTIFFKFITIIIIKFFFHHFS